MPLPHVESAAAPGFVPRLELYTEAMILNVGSAFDPQMQEKVLPVLSLSFDYGGVKVRASAGASVNVAGGRDLPGERRARQILESFGPLELGLEDILSARLGSRADYVVRTEVEPHALCSFSAYAVPQLRQLGFVVDVAADYPFQVVAGDPPFYAELEAEAGTRDWFNLELGIEVEVDGNKRRVNLLPTLLELLDHLPSSGRLEEAMPSRARCFAVALGNNRYVAVPPERIQMLLKVLRELYVPGEGDRQAVRFPALAARALAEMEAAFGMCEDGRPRLGWSGPPELRERGLGLLGGPPPSAGAPPAGLRAELRPYQQQGLAWLQHLRAHDAGGVLADDMGLGKTLQTIAHIVAEKEAGRLDLPALVVAPTSLMGNWQRELQRFAPYLRVVVMHGGGRHKLWPKLAHADVVLTTYPALVRDEEHYVGDAGPRFHLALLDEAQAIKNPRSQAHRAALAIAGQARHRLCLSGTPVENSLSELWALFEFLNPGLLGDAEWFAHRYTRPIEREGKTERLGDLRAQVAPFILRRMKDEVARELPPKTEIIRPVELRGAQRDLYESLRLAGHAEVRKAIAEKGLGASTITILDALMKLRQVCCDPRLLAGEAVKDVKESAKYELLMELIAQQRAAGRRLLVFSQFATMLGLIGAGLRERGVPFSLLTGATTNRQKAVDDFQSGRVEVFLISLKAGGTGLNLTTADTVVHYDPWWNPAAQAQATDRAHRIGQTKPVFVYNLIVAGSVEERMLALQRRKRQLAEGLLGRDPDGALLSAREVEGLFAPIEPTSED